MRHSIDLIFNINLPLTLFIMQKIIALSAASLLAATPAIAGPYVNVEANQKFDTGDYTSTLTEAHVGWELSWESPASSTSKVVRLSNS